MDNTNIALGIAIIVCLALAPTGGLWVIVTGVIAFVLLALRMKGVV